MKHTIISIDAYMMRLYRKNKGYWIMQDGTLEAGDIQDVEFYNRVQHFLLEEEIVKMIEKYEDEDCDIYGINTNSKRNERGAYEIEIT